MRSFFLFLLLIFLIVLSEQLRSRRVVYSAAESVANYEVTAHSAPIRIQVDNQIDVQIESTVLNNNNWPVSENTAMFIASSAYPGQAGNVIIYAHNWPDLFGQLHTLQPGQKIQLQTANGDTWSYQVQSVQEVEPTETTWLQPTQTEVLTLYTCSGVFDRKRLVVQAVPIFY